MSIPILSGFQELDRAPRRFLYFIVFNVISWQCIVGNALVLFARSLAIPASWVGFLLSFMPLSMLLVVTTAPLVTHLGSQRLMMTAWGLRCPIVSGIFVIPLVLSHSGLWPAQFVLMGATLGFCLLRALGGGGWFPWLHEVVPEHQRGMYFSTEWSIAQILGVVVALGQAIILHGNPGLNRFLVLYAVGIASGFISLIFMARVPGGRGTGGRITLGSSYAAYGVAFSDGSFLRFVGVVTLCFSSITWFTAALVLYMRDALAFSPQTIMLIMATGSLGILLTIRHWGRYADRAGSSHAMLLTLIGHAGSALVFLMLAPHTWWTTVLLLPAVVLANVFGAAFSLAAHRAMLNFVRPSGRVAYTNLWTVGTSLALGITPIVAGFCIEHWHLWGFRVCFATCAVTGVIGAVLSRLVVPDSGPLEHTWSSLINPALPVRTLGRIMWITFGLHERAWGVRLSTETGKES